MNTCECGCGAPVRRRFVKGHHLRSADVVARIVASSQRARGTLERNRRIVERLEAGERMQSVADAYGISQQRVDQIARQYGVPPIGPLVGNRNPSWNGGRIVTTQGYVMVYAPGHPRAKRSHVLEHVLVAEQKVGRPLREDECVHHVNGIKDDNRPENLQVLTHAEHSRLHNRKYSDDLLLDWLRWLALRLNHTPRQADIDAALPAAWTVYYDRFPSLTHAAHRAGLTPNGRGTPGHGGAPLPLNFRKQYGHLRQYTTPEALANALHGGTLTEHERHLQSDEAA